MLLAEILKGVEYRAVRGTADIDVKGVTSDSRNAAGGGLFVAVRGRRHDGHDFVAEAVARGAVAVIAERPARAAGVTEVLVEDARRALAQAAAAFYRYPAREIKVIGVTGTNGKTTVCYLLDSIYRAADYKTALFSTIKNHVNGVESPARLTTAEAPEIQRLLRQAAGAAVEVAVVEVSSHGLALERVGGINWAGAVFTNLSHDHLDFHADIEHYFGVKASLFASLDNGAAAVLNGDDPFGQRLAASLTTRKLTFGINQDTNDYRAESVTAGWDGATFEVAGPGGLRANVTSTLRGSFNVYNCLAAFAQAHDFGIAAETIREGIAALRSVPGRLETVNVSDDLRVIVDYAHSPDSMAKALGEIQRLAPDHLVVVFGCTGERDREKRPLLGALARRFADTVIITTDDPYYEDAAAIAAEVEAGLVAEGGEAGGAYEVILDRAAAIRRALALAPAGKKTVVAILGKGHETVQKVRGREIPFNDRAVVEAAMQPKC